MKKVLILHGWGGSDFPHWQSWLAGELARDYGNVCFPLLGNPHFPNKSKQMRQIKSILSEYKPNIVICHSLASVLWLHLCNELQIDPVDELLLVAPPSNTCGIEMIRKFFPYTAPSSLFAKNALLVTSSNDPYMQEEEARALQKELGIDMMILENAGHINDQSGFGEWHWVLNWVKERLK